MKNVNATIAGAAWGRRYIFLLNPADATRQCWVNVDNPDAGPSAAAAMAAYVTDRQLINVDIPSADATTLGL
jgi:hypothetical protein